MLCVRVIRLCSRDECAVVFVCLDVRAEMQQLVNWVAECAKNTTNANCLHTSSEGAGWNEEMESSITAIWFMTQFESH